MDRISLEKGIALQRTIDDKVSEVNAAHNGTGNITIVIKGYERNPITIPFSVCQPAVEEYLKNKLDEHRKEFEAL